MGDSAPQPHQWQDVERWLVLSAFNGPAENLGNEVARLKKMLGVSEASLKAQVRRLRKKYPSREEQDTKAEAVLGPIRKASGGSMQEQVYRQYLLGKTSIDLIDASTYQKMRSSLDIEARMPPTSPTVSTGQKAQPSGKPFRRPRPTHMGHERRNMLRNLMSAPGAPVLRTVSVDCGDGAVENIYNVLSTEPTEDWVDAHSKPAFLEEWGYLWVFKVPCIYDLGGESCGLLLPISLRRVVNWLNLVREYNQNPKNTARDNFVPRKLENHEWCDGCRQLAAQERTVLEQRNTRFEEARDMVIHADAEKRKLRKQGLKQAAKAADERRAAYEQKLREEADILDNIKEAIDENNVDAVREFLAARPKATE